MGSPLSCGKGSGGTAGGYGYVGAARQELPRFVRVAHNPPLLGKKGRPVVKSREELVESVSVSG